LIVKILLLYSLDCKIIEKYNEQLVYAEPDPEKMDLISYVLRQMEHILWGSHIRTFELARNLSTVMIQGKRSTRLLNATKEIPALFRADGILIFGYKALLYDIIVFDILQKRGRSLVFDIADIPYLQPKYFGVQIDEQRHRIIQKNFDRLLGISDTLLLISPTLASMLNTDISKKRTIFIPNASNPQVFKKTSIPKNEKKIILYVGGYAPMRGIESLIEAFSILRIKRQDVMLKLVGSNIPDEMAIGDGIVIERNKFYEEIPEVYSGSHVCVIPHLKNPYMDAALPIKLFDTMASARPVITTDCLEASKLVNDEKCGIVTKNNNPQCLAESIDYLLSNPALAQELGERGRAAVEKRHSWEHRAQAIIHNLEK
jgi:glycosyltransferase involved in cell wall biosynthesis